MIYIYLIVKQTIMPQAEFYVVDGETSLLLEATTCDMAQKEVLNEMFDPMELVIQGKYIRELFTPPVFDFAQENGLNIGKYGDKTSKRQDWVRGGSVYILRK